MRITLHIEGEETELAPVLLALADPMRLADLIASSVAAVLTREDVREIVHAPDNSTGVLPVSEGVPLESYESPITHGEQRSAYEPLAIAPSNEDEAVSPPDAGPTQEPEATPSLLNATQTSGHPSAPAPPPDEPSKKLTQRQAECLELAKEGLTNQEIADRLDILPGNVSFHLSQAYARLGIPGLGRRGGRKPHQAFTPPPPPAPVVAAAVALPDCTCPPFWWANNQVREQLAHYRNDRHNHLCPLHAHRFRFGAQGSGEAVHIGKCDCGAIQDTRVNPDGEIGVQGNAAQRAAKEAVSA